MRRSKPQPPDTILQRLAVESLDIDAQGIAHHADGKVVFIEGALPLEEVDVRVTRSKASFDKGVAITVHRESSQRVAPRCPHFGLHDGACGGCKMQHLHRDAQVAVKQRALEDALWHLGKVRPERLLRPVQGPVWGYRYRARLSVRYVRKKDAVLVGFHERKSSYVADMGECHVLPPFVGLRLLPALRVLVMGMDARETCPQIELAMGDTARGHGRRDAQGQQLPPQGQQVVALVLRHLEPLTAADTERLRDFARAHCAVFEGRDVHLEWWLQPNGPDTIHLLDPDTPSPLAYELPEFGLHMPFRPTDFTQVNPQVNRVLVDQALRLLDVQATERVIDWFCGLGNFSLPLATRAAQVLGVEGSKVLVARATDNYRAASNDVSRLAPLAPTQFVARDLFGMTPEMLVQDGMAQKWLVDPPREGAFALAKALADIHQARLAGDATGGVPGAVAWQPPQRIVYVSCNPATLARDAGLLVHQAGYRLALGGAVNMFPHTAHVESIAVFERDAAP